MGRKRKDAAKEDKTSNRCSETIYTQEKLHTDYSNAMAPNNVEKSVEQNSNGLRIEKKSKVLNMVVRRSDRLKSSVLPSENLVAKPILEHVNLVENEMDKEAPSQKANTLPGEKEKDSEMEMNERSLKEKVDYLVSVADEFKSKTAKQVDGRPVEGSPPDISYKSLYFTSQKKIEALIEENYDLVRKLEFARGKIAAYEAMKDSAAKEVYLVSAWSKATEAGVSLSPQPVQTCIPTPAAAPATIHGDADDPKPRNKYQKKKKDRGA